MRLDIKEGEKVVRVAINGFGRIGRMVLRAGFADKKIEIVAINDLSEPATSAHLLKYDSVYHRFPGEVKAENGSLVVNGKKIKLTAERDPTQLPWKELKIDVVVESTGVFTKRDDAMKHVTAGAKKVLVSAPSDDADLTIVRGVTDKQYDKKKHTIISNGSCTTNSIVPLAFVLHQNFKIKRGFMTTVHSYTNDQNLQDGPHRDLRRARAAALSMIPTSTGAARTVGVVIPELKGKVDGIAIRVPTPVGSITDFVCEVENDTNVEEVNAVVKKACAGNMKGIMQYVDEPIVSSDIIGNPHSSIFDSQLTKVGDKKMLKVFAWYDNEWGFSNRMVEVIKLL